jgi:hypothetical protein
MSGGTGAGLVQGFGVCFDQGAGVGRIGDAQIHQPAAEHEEIILHGRVPYGHVIGLCRRGGPVGHPQAAPARRRLPAARVVRLWGDSEIAELLRDIERILPLGNHFENAGAIEIAPHRPIENAHEGLRLAIAAKIGHRQSGELSVWQADDALEIGLLRRHNRQRCGGRPRDPEDPFHINSPIRISFARRPDYAENCLEAEAIAHPIPRAGPKNPRPDCRCWWRPSRWRSIRSAEW